MKQTRYSIRFSGNRRFNRKKKLYRKRSTGTKHKFVLPALFGFFSILCYFMVVPGMAIHLPEIFQRPDLTIDPEIGMDIDNDKSGSKQPGLDKADLKNFLHANTFFNTDTSFIETSIDGKLCLIESSIDIDLQESLVKSLDTATARHIGIVAMDPDSGRILAMAGYDRDAPNSNPCINTLFPAASIFKIITAAAAIDECGFLPETGINISGALHTLYKFQMKPYTRRQTFRITLKDSFAKSVNPVFGKIGIHYLGKNTLIRFAEAFGFNQEIDFEIPFVPSVINIKDNQYHWAEIASGFNRQTRISPLHGAVIASVILNQGALVSPIIVERVFDTEGNTIYESRPTAVSQAISPDSSNAMIELMKATVKIGTCRKAFRKYRKSKILKRLEIGGKTGSINSRKHEGVRFDWFVGYAAEKQGNERLIISAVVAHDKLIGKRSKNYAFDAFKTYFGRYFAKMDENNKANNGQTQKAVAAPTR